MGSDTFQELGKENQKSTGLLQHIFFGSYFLVDNSETHKQSFSLSDTQRSWQIYRTMVRHEWKVSFSSSGRCLQTHCTGSCVPMTVALRNNKNKFLGFQGAFKTKGNNNYIIVFFSFINVLKNQIPSIQVLLELRLHMQQNPLRDEICAFSWMTTHAFSLRALLKVQDGSLLEQIWAFFPCFV